MTNYETTDKISELEAKILKMKYHIYTEVITTYGKCLKKMLEDKEEEKFNKLATEYFDE